MRNDHTPGTEHFTDMLQNENARRLGPTAEGPRCEAVWAAPLRAVCCIFPAVTWKDARLAPLLVWDTPKKPFLQHCNDIEKYPWYELNKSFKQTT